MGRPVGYQERSSEVTRPRAIDAARAVVLFVLIAAPIDAWCQIYTGTSSQSGSIVLSSFATDDAKVLLMPAASVSGKDGLVALRPPRSSVAGRDKPLPAELRGIIDVAASRSAVSPRLIRAVMEAESRFEPAAVSSRGAIGLMQLLPDTAKRFGAADPFDPMQNVAAGAAYLRWLMAYFGDDLELVLAGYNAGEQAVVKAGRRIPPFAETQSYVKKVMARLQGPEADDL
jgi:soluble lytic murein transglycosylase-like protein